MNTKRSRPDHARKILVALAAGSLLAAGVAALRVAGFLEPAEIALHDVFLKWRCGSAVRHDIITVVEFTEADLRREGYPNEDARLAELLDRIGSGGPAAIGLDIYRDLPVPRDGSQQKVLAASFARHPQLIAITSAGRVSPPPSMPPERVASNDLPLDARLGGAVRRAFAEVDDGNGKYFTALATQLAELWLTAHGIAAADDGKFRMGTTEIRQFRGNDGPYAGTPDGGYQYLLDFRRAPDFRRVSAGKVLAGAIPVSEFRNRIVLIGVTAESVPDEKRVPVWGEIRGVMLHALVTDQLLRAALNGDTPDRPVPEWTEYALIFAAALGGALAASRFFHMAAILGAVALFGGSWLLFRAGVMFPVGGALVSLTLATGCVAAWAATTEKRERALLDSLFSRHLSPEIAGQIWERRAEFIQGGRLMPQGMVATVMFTDLQGYSTASELIAPAQLMEWMNDYFDAVATQVEKHGGIVDKFIGDAIMAVFSVPFGDSSEAAVARGARAAADCALEMAVSLAQLNARWQQQGRATTAMRIGICTGPLVAGSVGSRGRLNFTVMGDTVNTAARLQSAGKEQKDSTPAAQQCVILLADSTASKIGGHYETVQIGELALKGKAIPVSVHRLAGIRAQQPGDARR